MSEFVGEQFEDFGNAMECVVSKIGGYEYLSNGLCRVFFCKEFHSRVVLDHTTLLSRQEMRVLAKRLLEIADAPTLVPHWAVSMVDKLVS